MKTHGLLQTSKVQGFSLMELLVVVGILAILAGLGMPALIHASERAKSTHRASNLRATGIALYSFAAEHQDSYPWQTSPEEGGTKDAIFFSEHLLVLSNDLPSTQVLYCPTDTARIRDQGILERDLLGPSYNIGKDVSPVASSSILATDRNLNDSQYDRAAAAEAYWDREIAQMHAARGGNVLLTDGSVHFWSDLQLREAIAADLLATSRETVEFLHRGGLILGVTGRIKRDHLGSK